MSEQRYFAVRERVFDARNRVGGAIAVVNSFRMAKRIANALNLYKVRPRKRRAAKVEVTRDQQGR